MQAMDIAVIGIKKKIGLIANDWFKTVLQQIVEEVIRLVVTKSKIGEINPDDWANGCHFMLSYDFHRQAPCRASRNFEPLSPQKTIRQPLGAGPFSSRDRPV